MLRASITLLIIGLIAMLFGMYNLAGLSFEGGRGLLFAFLALSILGLLKAIFSGKRAGPPV